MRLHAPSSAAREGFDGAGVEPDPVRVPWCRSPRRLGAGRRWEGGGVEPAAPAVGRVEGDHPLLRDAKGLGDGLAVLGPHAAGVLQYQVDDEVGPPLLGYCRNPHHSPQVPRLGAQEPVPALEAAGAGELLAGAAGDDEQQRPPRGLS